MKSRLELYEDESTYLNSQREHFVDKILPDHKPMKRTFVKSEMIEPEEEEDKRKEFVYSGSLLRTSP